MATPETFRVRLSPFHGGSFAGARPCRMGFHAGLVRKRHSSKSWTAGWARPCTVRGTTRPKRFSAQPVLNSFRRDSWTQVLPAGAAPCEDAISQLYSKIDALNGLRCPFLAPCHGVVWDDAGCSVVWEVHGAVLTPAAPLSEPISCDAARSLTYAALSSAESLILHGFCCSASQFATCCVVSLHTDAAPTAGVVPVGVLSSSCVDTCADARNRDADCANLAEFVNLVAHAGSARSREDTASVTAALSTPSAANLTPLMRMLSDGGCAATANVLECCTLTSLHVQDVSSLLLELWRSMPPPATASDALFQCCPSVSIDDIELLPFERDTLRAGLLGLPLQLATGFPGNILQPCSTLSLSLLEMLAWMEDNMPLHASSPEAMAGFIKLMTVPADILEFRPAVLESPCFEK